MEERGTWEAEIARLQKTAGGRLRSPKVLIVLLLRDASLLSGLRLHASISVHV